MNEKIKDFITKEYSLKDIKEFGNSIINGVCDTYSEVIIDFYEYKACIYSKDAKRYLLFLYDTAENVLISNPDEMLRILYRPYDFTEIQMVSSNKEEAVYRIKDQIKDLRVASENQGILYYHLLKRYSETFANNMYNLMKLQQIRNNKPWEDMDESKIKVKAIPSTDSSPLTVKVTSDDMEEYTVIDILGFFLSEDDFFHMKLNIYINMVEDECNHRKEEIDKDCDKKINRYKELIDNIYTDYE